MKVAFHCNHLGIAGTEVAVYDYAYYNQTLLNNESIIIARNSANDNADVIEKFNKQFKVIRYNDLSEIDKIVEENKVNVFHALKSGEFDGVITKVCKAVIHAVFMTYQPHGNVYAYISKWVASKMNYGLNPWVPHMINLPNVDENLRKTLNIPEDAFVIGRYGSFGSFDIPFAQDAVKQSLNERNDLYFLFANTREFYKHSRIIYLDPIAELNEKVKFINTCDAMLHARYRGETFGIACGEFSIKNKPVITYSLSPEKAHIDILKDKGIYYTSYFDLLKILKTIEKNNKNYDAYSEEYIPEKVMKKFKTIFL